MLIVTLILTGSLQVIAQVAKETPPSPPPLCIPPQPPRLELPDLSEDQKTALKKCDLGNLKEMTSLQNQLREKQAHLVALLTAGDPDAKELDQTIRDIGDIHTKILKQQVTHDQEIRLLLTPDQKIIFDANPKPFLRNP